MKRQLLRVNALVLVFVLVLTSISLECVSAISKKPTYSVTTSFTSSTNQKEEYFKIKTPSKEDDTIYVEGKTKGTTKRLCIRITNQSTKKHYITVFVKPNKNNEFSIKINTKKGNKKVPTVLNKKGTVTSASGSYSTQPGYKSVSKIPAGIYYMTISKATTTADAKVSKNTKWWNGQLGSAEGYCFRGTLFRVKKGDENNLKLIQYKSVVTNNQTIRNQYEANKNTDSAFEGSYVRYLDPYMKDIEFVFKNPKTGKFSNMTDSRVAYMKKTADKITKGADTDYEKSFKIYEYVAKNFYYDVLAWEKSKNQYANPYLNLYNLRNKKSSANSTSTGKVATNCHGYAALVVGLARAEGIPARLVSGNHGDSSKALWSASKLSTLNTTDHWWAEVYVDGRWIFVDACSGNLSKWKRTSFSAKGTWTKTNISYAYFDPTDKFIANNFIYHDIYRGSNGGEFICNKDEVGQLRAFLNAEYDGMTNGLRVNDNYSESDYTTWDNGNGKFRTNGYGRVDYIDWAKDGLYGDINLDNFTALKYLMLYTNNLTDVSLDNCTSLVNVSITYNDLTTFDASDSKLMEKLSLKGNPLTSVKFRDGSKLVTVKSNESACTFSLDYNQNNSKKLTIYAGKVPSGYQYLGIYNPSGKRISQSTEYSFNPSKGTYTVKYKKL